MLVVRQLDLFAEAVRRVAKVGPDEVVDAAELSIRLLGEGSVVIVDRLACGARLRRTDSGYCIELEDNLPDMNFAAAHEVAHWALRVLAHYEGQHEERYANYVGAALLMPRTLVRAGLQFYGHKLEALEPLSSTVMVSRTAVNLRLGEVSGDARAVVTRTGHVLRNDVAAFAEPDRDVIVRARRDRETRGVVRAQLRGGIDEGRVALRAK